MISAAAIAITIERVRDHALPGREAVEIGDAWHVVTRMISAERREVRDRHRRRDAILVRLPVCGR